MNLTKAKEILYQNIDAKMFDDPEFYDYLLACFSKIDSVKNDIDDTQMKILLTVSSSIAETLASIRLGEHDESMTDADKQIAEEQERTIVEFLDYLTSYRSGSAITDSAQNLEGIAQ